MDVWAKLFGYTGNIYYDIAIALLIGARLVAILQLTPFLGGKLVPNQVKVATAVALSLLLFPIVKGGTLTKPLPNLGPIFAIYLMKEIFIGMAIGFLASLTFQALEAAGNFLDTARGASMANVLVPQLEEQGPILSQLNVQLGIVIFLVLNGHHYFLRAVFQSFTILPIDTFPTLGANISGFVDFMIRATANLMVVAMQIVIPALIAIFMVDVVLGIANRAAPQINVFFLGMPIKAYVGIVFALLALNYMSQILTTQFRFMLRDLNTVIHMLAAR